MKRSGAASDLLRLMGSVADERVAAIKDGTYHGLIGPGMTLSVARWTFPAGSWRQGEWFTLPDPVEQTTPASVGDHGNHDHAVPRPALFAPLAPGDRVVVLLYLDGTEPVVICRTVGT